MSIRAFLLNKGFNPKFKGFDCIEKGIELISEDRKYLRNISKVLYPKISEELQIKYHNIDRNIRNCVKASGMKITCAQLFAILEIEYSALGDK